MTPEIDRTAYDLAKDYLPSFGIPGVTTSLIERYLSPSALPPRPTTTAGLFQRILEAAQNANMKAGVIGRAVGGVAKLAPVLEDFDPKAVQRVYGLDSESLLDRVVSEVRPRGKIRRAPRCIWPQYCRTILSAAAFINQFEAVSDFYDWVDLFDRDDRIRPSLPMLLSHEVDGLGFALSCSLLKELGYSNFPKPDVHLRDTFTALGLVADGGDDYRLFKATVRVARSSGVSPYSVDKVFWLIGSGNFYDDRDIGDDGRIGSRKQEFIEYATPLLWEKRWAPGDSAADGRRSRFSSPAIIGRRAPAPLPCRDLDKARAEW